MTNRLGTYFNNEARRRVYHDMYYGLRYGKRGYYVVYMDRICPITDDDFKQNWYYLISDDFEFRAEQMELF